MILSDWEGKPGGSLNTVYDLSPAGCLPRDGISCGPNARIEYWTNFTFKFTVHRTSCDIPTRSSAIAARPRVPRVVEYFG